MVSWMIFAVITLRMVFFWIVLIVFLFIKNLGAQTKLNIRRTAIHKRKISLASDIIIYTTGFSNELETVHFLNHFVFLKPCLYQAAQTTRIITWKQMFLYSKNKKWGNLKFLLMNSSVFWGTPISRNNFQWPLQKIRYVT